MSRTFHTQQEKNELAKQIADVLSDGRQYNARWIRNMLHNKGIEATPSFIAAVIRTMPGFDIEYHGGKAEYRLKAKV